MYGLASVDTLRIVAAYDTLILAFKVLECLRATDATAFYARLIVQTFKDMSWFLVILFGLIIISAVTFYIHDMNSIEKGFGEQGNFMPLNSYDARFLNNVAYQYLMTLGEFDIDHLMDSEDKPSPFLLFFVYTFVI